MALEKATLSPTSFKVSDGTTFTARAPISLDLLPSSGSSVRAGVDFVVINAEPASKLEVGIANIGPNPQPPVGPGTYTLGTVTGVPRGERIAAAAVPITTDAQGNPSAQHKSPQSGTVVLSSFSRAGVQGHIDAIVNGVPYTGDFTASMCGTIQSPCSNSCGGTAALRGIQPSPNRALATSRNRTQIAKKAGAHAAVAAKFR